MHTEAEFGEDQVRYEPIGCVLAPITLLAEALVLGLMHLVWTNHWFSIVVSCLLTIFFGALAMVFAVILWKAFEIDGDAEKSYRQWLLERSAALPSDPPAKTP